MTIIDFKRRQDRLKSTRETLINKKHVRAVNNSRGYGLESYDDADILRIRYFVKMLKHEHINIMAKLNKQSNGN
jgi:hypothetical protein